MRRFAALVMATLLAAAAAFAEPQGATTELSPEEAYRTAFTSLEAGKPGLANAIADALLIRNPGSYRVLILKSRAARSIGLFAEAAAAGRAAWRAAEDKPQRFTAAMVTAQALSSDGKRTRAQLWLRRAADRAPTEATRAMAVRDFRYVRARNPWSTELSFNVTPSSNVNNGSARETTQLYGLPFEFQLSGAARALEGVEYATSVGSRYRFAQGADHAHDLVVQLSHRTYSLTADARAQAPGVSGSDFAFSQAALGYVYQRRPQVWPGPYTLSAMAGHSWYGGADYFSYLRLGGTQKIALGDKAALSFSGSGERQFGIGAPDAGILRADLRLSRQIGDLGRLGLSLSHTDSGIGPGSAERRVVREGRALWLPQH